MKPTYALEAFLLGIASSGAAVLLLRAMAKWYRGRRLATVRAIWCAFSDTETLVVVTGRAGPYPRSTDKISICEARALLLISERLSQVNSKFRVVSSLQIQPDDCRNVNVILLGSQKANAVTAAIAQHLNLPFGYDARGNLASAHRNYPTDPDDDSPIESDHSLVVKCDNPFAPNRALLIIAGNHGAATEGAARAIADPAWAGPVASAVGQEHFAAVLHFDIRRNTPMGVQMRFCRKFEEVTTGL